MNAPEEQLTLALTLTLTLALTLTGTTDLMNAPEEQLTQRTYNLNGMSFTPREQACPSLLIHITCACHTLSFTPREQAESQ